LKASKLFKITFSLLLIASLLFSTGCKKPATQPDGTAGSTAGIGTTDTTGTAPTTPDNTEKEEPFIPVLRFMVTSDVHIRKESEDLQSHQILADFYKTAYDYADNHPDYKKLDGIFFLGDISNNGYEEEQTYFFNYVKEHTREGTYTRTVMGNHEFMATGNFSGNSVEEAPKEFLKYSGYDTVDYHTTMGGYHFIFLSMDSYKKNDGGTTTFFSSEKLIWLRAELDKAVADTPGKPIFVFQHTPPSGTMVGSTSTSGDPNLNTILRQYPQVIDFSGHTHVPMTHPSIISQRDYTALNTGSLCYMSAPMYDAKGKMTRTKQMNDTGMYTTAVHQDGPRNGVMYYIVEIDTNSVVRIQRYNMLTKSVWGEPFILDSVNPADFKYKISELKKQAVKPAFDASAVITLESADAENPMISFPQAICKDIVANYRIEFYQNDTLVHTIYRMSETYFGDATPNPLRTNLGKLKAGTYTLKVYAISSYALHSDPITATITVQ